MPLNNLIKFLKEPFMLLDKKQNRWLLVVVTGLFVIIFMNLYVPFNISRWYEHERLPLWLILSSFGLIGMAVLAISQLYIRPLISSGPLKIYGGILWFLAELGLLTITMYIIYGDKHLSGFALIGEIIITLKYTLLILIIPYSAVLMYLYAKQKDNSSQGSWHAGDHLVKFMDDHGTLQIAIDLENLLFVKSSDNYVEVYFLKDSKVRKELVRTTMKKLDVALRDFPIRRCHRSYMVNINKITLTERNSKGLSLTLQGYPVEPIPVSKNFKHLFSQSLIEKNNFLL